MKQADSNVNKPKAYVGSEIAWRGRVLFWVYIYI